jgi:hypothetical protein
MFLTALQRFEYIDHPRYPGERKVSTLEYAYTLSHDETLGVSLFSWEWNPSSEVWPEPHLHIGRGNPEVAGLHKHHIPTGRVALEHVLLYAIAHHGVELEDPVESRKVLDDCLRRFNANRSW